MKTLFASILVALTVSTSSISFAAAPKNHGPGQVEQTNKASATVLQVLMSKLDVVVEEDANPRTTIRLTDANGNNIATKKVANNELANRVRFDLAELADGMYYVKVWNGQNTQVQKFELKTAAVSLTAFQKLAIM